MNAKTILRDSWRTLAAMALVLCAMLASVLVLDQQRETCLTEQGNDPHATIRIFVEAE